MLRVARGMNTACVRRCSFRLTPAHASFFLQSFSAICYVLLPARRTLSRYDLRRGDDISVYVERAFTMRDDEGAIE